MRRRGALPPRGRGGRRSVTVTGREASQWLGRGGRAKPCRDHQRPDAVPGRFHHAIRPTTIHSDPSTTSAATTASREVAVGPRPKRDQRQRRTPGAERPSPSSTAPSRWLTASSRPAQRAPLPRGRPCGGSHARRCTRDADRSPPLPGSRSGRRRVAAGSSTSSSATAKPSVSGSRTSRSTSSGRSERDAATADAPSAASPTTVKPSASSSRRARRRKPAWSSTISTVRLTADRLMRRSVRGIGEIPTLRSDRAGPGISSMRLRGTRPTVVGMNNGHLLRVGAVAAISGAGAQLVATVLEPDWSDDPDEAIRIVAESGFWTGGRLIDLIGVFLTVGALTVVGRTFTEGPGTGVGQRRPALPRADGRARGGCRHHRCEPGGGGGRMGGCRTRGEAVVRSRVRHDDQPHRGTVLRRVHGAGPVPRRPRDGDPDARRLRAVDRLGVGRQRRPRALGRPARARFRDGSSSPCSRASCSSRRC